ncbi:2-C-methyl-D-erythritol 4-phosphate cytidylyltransferase, partial [Salmonella enterica subsp. enterica serovar Kentucky]|nr:2-C-methyl-D-erythritol 4-phosphate cytidylyltransferase [Salmonella enterica subsp. enterica serovar Kentucky]
CWFATGLLGITMMDLAAIWHNIEAVMVETMSQTPPEWPMVLTWHALTPQFFPRELLHDCLTRALNEGATITDEASALEYCGFHP